MDIWIYEDVKDEKGKTSSASNIDSHHHIYIYLSRRPREGRPTKEEKGEEATKEEANRFRVAGRFKKC